MKILHLCLSGPYSVGFGYQENILPRLNKAHSHEVLVISSTETYKDNVNLECVDSRLVEIDCGVPVKRLPYVKLGPAILTRKIRLYRGLYQQLVFFDPDVIFSHNLAFLSVRDVVRYVKKHPNVVFYADTHTAFHNSGRNWISLNILHKFIYRNAMRPAIPLLKKYFYIGSDERIFSSQIYKIPDELMEFYPLGGTVFDDDSYYEKRNKIRGELGVPENDFLFVHSGKMNKNKRVLELIQGFKRQREKSGKLIIIGSVDNDIKVQFDSLIKGDSTIKYLGWKTAEELQDYLCAADLYCQPGSVSSTMQTSVCCRCPVMVNTNAPYHFCDEFENLIWVDSVDDIAEVFDNILNGKIDLKTMSMRSKACADRFFDYDSLARRIEQ